MDLTHVHNIYMWAKETGNLVFDVFWYLKAFACKFPALQGLHARSPQSDCEISYSPKPDKLRQKFTTPTDFQEVIKHDFDNVAGQLRELDFENIKTLKLEEAMDYLIRCAYYSKTINMAIFAETIIVNQKLKSQDLKFVNSLFEKATELTDFSINFILQI